ncbi:serine/threonine-protein kinase pim-1-like [Conger conger]|uniref:serine/threonine-protein kinase pim-1-like n=1 Tax=Conger conger TaxID=82655 RepID=UPI002A5A2A17|nr:serine/threonine-protein kinase pim-1-like [Conger conger]
MRTRFIDLTNVSSSSSEKKRKCLKNPSIVDLTGLSSCGSEWKKSQYLSFGKISVSPSSSGQSSTSSLLQDLLSDCPSGASSGIDYKVFEAKYREEHLLGYGGFGSVWAGYRKGDLLPTLGGRQQEVPLEVAILNIVGSGNPAPKGIVCLLDWCNLPTEVLLVLERPQPCEDLFDYISKGRVHLEEEEAKVIMRQLLEAVQLIHNRGVVHRDLKPENVLIESGSGYLHAHLIDFGCANLMEQSPFTHFRGTALYTAPEWFTENKLDGVSSTVWQLGMILYEMLHLERPFSNIKQIIENPLMLRHGLSAECQDLLRWCLEKRPQGRPTVEEIGQHPWLH